MLPRERYVLLGPDPFTAPELLSLLLGTGAGGRTSRAIAAELLEHFGSLPGIAAAPVAAIAAIRGVGTVRAIRIHAGLTLGRRSVQAPQENVGAVRTAAEAAAWFLSPLGDLDHEELHALYLDRRARPLGYRRLSSGTDGCTIIDARQILSTGLHLRAFSVILAHNHPSGHPEPSPDDILSTRRIQEAAPLVGLQLLDHLVMAPPRWVSLSERGELGR